MWQILIVYFSERKSKQYRRDKFQLVLLQASLCVSVYFWSMHSTQVEEGEKTGEVYSDKAVQSELSVAALSRLFLKQNYC